MTQEFKNVNITHDTKNGNYYKDYNKNNNMVKSVI